MKKTICFILSAVLITGLCLPAAADGDSFPVATEYMSDDLYDPLPAAAEPSADGSAAVEVKAEASVLIEPETLRVLYENNADARLAPASITKIMSLLLIMEGIEAGKLSLEDEITASEHACSMGGSQIWLEPGEKMTLDDLLKAISVASANDATVAVAEALCGSEESFVAEMNRRASELSMTGTNFVNCTGLDAEGHYTTAYDVALMSCELIKHELITKYSTVWMDTLRGGKSQLVNTNKLVKFYNGCIGLKTGTTSTAGYCLSAAARRDGTTLIAVVMKGESGALRFEGARKLLDYGFANFTCRRIGAELPEDTFVKIKRGEKQKIRCEAAGELSVVTKKGEADIKRQIDLPDILPAPVKSGDAIGRVIISLDGEEIGEIEIKAVEDSKKLTLFSIYFRLLSELF